MVMQMVLASDMLVNLNNLMWPSAPHHFTELRPYSKFTSKLGKFTNCLLISHKNRQQQHEKLLVNVTATTDDHFPTESHLHAETVCVCVCVLSVHTFLPPVICLHRFFQSVLLEVFTATAKLSNSKYLQQGGCFLHYVYCFCSNLKQV